ncbi:MAG: hypothetical protein QG556_823 [Pseudomonadota bacterium]|nr:hypothetical protein [Pseudomonadota bacterium]
MNRPHQYLILVVTLFSGMVLSYDINYSLLPWYENILPAQLLIEYQKQLLSEKNLSTKKQNLLIYKLGKNHLIIEDYEKALPYFQMSILHPVSQDLSLNTSKKIQQLQAISYGEDLSKAISFLEKAHPQKTIQILYPYRNQPSFIVHMLLGKAYAMKNQPNEAIVFFKKSQSYSQNNVEKNEASKQIFKMQEWIKFNQKPKALPALSNPIKRISPWEQYFIHGKQLYNHDQPIEAMDDFKKAYVASQNDSEKNASLLYILKTANWIQDFKQAFHTYHLLEKKDLNAEEKNILLTEHAKTLLNLDYPRHAIFSLSKTTPLTTPDSVLTLASCYLSAGLPYQTKKLIEQPQSQRIIQTIPTNSYLHNRKKDIDYQIMQNTSKAMLNFDFARIQDSTQFIINRETGEGNYRTFGTNSNTSVMLSKSQYYNPIHYVNSDILFIKQDFLNIHDKLDLSAAVIPTQVRYLNSNGFNPWNPLLWQVSANLKQNDYFNLYAFNNTVLVETIPALQNNILMNNSEGTINLHPLNFAYFNFTFAGSYFSDTNQRLGGAASFLYQLSSRYGIFSKIRYRRFQNSYYDNPNYFSPQSMQEGDLFLIFKKRLTMTTFLYAEGSVGLQQLQVNPTEDLSKQTVYTTQINLAQKITKYAQLTLSYSYVQNVFNNLVGPYSQEYFGANLKIFLD